MTYPNYFSSMFPCDDFPKYSWSEQIRSLPNEVWTTDTTYKDGRQGGLELNMEQSVRVYECMCDFTHASGAVRQTELYVFSQEQREVFYEIYRLYRNGRPIEPVAWVSNREYSMDMLRDVCKEVQLTEAGVFVPVSDHYIHHCFNINGREKAKAHYLKAIAGCFDLGIRPNIHLGDATRASTDFMMDLVESIMKLSTKYPRDQRPKFRVCDTVGVGLPYEFVDLPRSIPLIFRNLVKLGLRPYELEFHSHNEMHFNVANCISAIMEGCGVINGTFFGIGERTGNAPIEGILIHLIGMGYYSTSKPEFGALNRLIKLYSDMSFAIPDNLPYFGKRSHKPCEEKIRATLNDNPSCDRENVWKLFEAYNSNELLKQGKI